MMSRSKSPTHRLISQSETSLPAKTGGIPQVSAGHSTVMPSATTQQDSDVLFPYKSTTSQQHKSYGFGLKEKQQSYLNEVRELQGSHLDTPAPRAKVPKPTPNTLPENSHNSKSTKYPNVIIFHF